MTPNILPVPVRCHVLAIPGPGASLVHALARYGVCNASDTGGWLLVLLAARARSSSVFQGARLIARLRAMIQSLCGSLVRLQTASATCPVAARGKTDRAPSALPAIH